MLVWRTLKRYEETGNIQKRHGPGRSRTTRSPKLVKSNREKIRRNPKRCIQNLAKESNVSYVAMSTVLRKDLKMPSFKYVKKDQLSAQVVDERLHICNILLSRTQDGILPNLLFGDERKFDVDHHFNTQNDRVWSRNGDEESRVVGRKQCPASVMVWAGVTESGRRLLFFVDQGVKFNQQNYRNDILLVHCCPKHESTSKTVSGLFSGTLHHHIGPKRLRSVFQRMFRTSLPETNGSYLPLIWIL